MTSVFDEIREHLECPNCLSHLFYPHCQYWKHHGGEQILIQRVMCRSCRVTHALIPEFSLPQTSQDTFAVTTYLLDRSKGESRQQASADILTMGFAFKTLKNLERSFIRCSHNLAALLKFTLPSQLSLESLTKQLGLSLGSRCLLEINQIALKSRYNAVYNSRSSILIFSHSGTRKRFPLNLDSAQDSHLVSNSC